MLDFTIIVFTWVFIHYGPRVSNYTWRKTPYVYHFPSEGILHSHKLLSSMFSNNLTAHAACVRLCIKFLIELKRTSISFAFTGGPWKMFKICKGHSDLYFGFYSDSSFEDRCNETELKVSARHIKSNARVLSLCRVASRYQFFPNRYWFMVWIYWELLYDSANSW